MESETHSLLLFLTGMLAALVLAVALALALAAGAEARPVTMLLIYLC